MKKACFLIIILVLLLTSCKSTQQETYTFKENDPFKKQNITFLNKKASYETFRVLLSSDYYIVKQLMYKQYIKRKKDKGGDSYMTDEIKKMDIINEAREGIIKIWLYPDSGKIMKVRTLKPTSLVEIDKLITEDIQRWNFKFPKNYVTPTKFEINYRVVLQKKLNDEQVIQRIRKKLQ